MQNLLLDILEANLILFGEVNWLNALIYSIWGISSIELKTIAWYFLGNCLFAVVSAKVLGFLDCGSVDKLWGELDF